MSRFLANFPAYPNTDAKFKTKNMAMTNQCTDSEKKNMYKYLDNGGTMKDAAIQNGGDALPGATSHMCIYIYIAVYTCICNYRQVSIQFSASILALEETAYLG